MAGLGGKNWAFQEEVTSSDVNGFLADQVVMRFADTATRTAGFGGSGEPTLAEGMLSYLDDANRVDFYNGSAWKPVSQILQVVNTIKTDTFASGTVSAGAEIDITGLSATITPSSTSSQILVAFNVYGCCVVGGNQRPLLSLRCYRGATLVGAGAAAGNRSRLSGQNGILGVNDGFGHVGATFLDSPSTTSATTYKLTAVHMSFDAASTSNIYINRTSPDSDFNYFPRTASFITLMEVAG